MTSMLRVFAVSVLALLAGAGCGYTVGDGCTTNTDCGSELCINRDNTPGGYCSKTCRSEADCPHGTTCVEDGAQPSVSACFRSCESADECRPGYQCLGVRNTGRTVCIASGF